MPIELLVVTPSEYRRCWYIHDLANYGFDVQVVANGVECIERLCVTRPQILLLEACIQWGGVDGVLAVRNEDAALRGIPVVVVAPDGVSAEVYRLANFPIQGFFGRLPRAAELAASLLPLARYAASSPSPRVNSSLGRIPPAVTPSSPRFERTR